MIVTHVSRYLFWFKGRSHPSLCVRCLLVFIKQSTFHDIFLFIPCHVGISYDDKCPPHINSYLDLLHFLTLPTNPFLKGPYLLTDLTRRGEGLYSLLCIVSKEVLVFLGSIPIELIARITLTVWNPKGPSSESLLLVTNPSNNPYERPSCGRPLLSVVLTRLLSQPDTTSESPPKVAGSPQDFDPTGKPHQGSTPDLEIRSGIR